MVAITCSLNTPKLAASASGVSSPHFGEVAVFHLCNATIGLQPKHAGRFSCLLHQSKPPAPIACTFLGSLWKVLSRCRFNPISKKSYCFWPFGTHWPHISAKDQGTNNSYRSINAASDLTNKSCPKSLGKISLRDSNSEENSTKIKNGRSKICSSGNLTWLIHVSSLKVKFQSVGQKLPKSAQFIVASFIKFEILNRFNWNQLHLIHNSNRFQCPQCCIVFAIKNENEYFLQRKLKLPRKLKRNKKWKSRISK